MTEREKNRTTQERRTEQHKMNTATSTLLLFLTASSLLFLLLPFAASDNPLPPPLNEEVLALIAFKSSLQDPTSALSSWSATDPTPCSWAHVLCDPSTSAVTHLSLSSLSLSASRPLFPSLSLLPSLQSVSLSDNNLSGPLPASLPLSLRSLDLSVNSLSGPIPPSLPSSLRFLSLSTNSLSGPIPSSLSGCSFLLHLNISNNILSGELPSPVFSLLRLRALDISNNRLSGAVQDGLAGIHNLKILSLKGNRFSGPIPLSIGLCPHLYSVDLSGNDFTGGMPSTMRLLYSLSYLSLSNNRISGELPAWIGDLGSLQYLDLSGNELTGSLPETMRGLKELTYLGLSDNMLTGTVPEWISECEKLSEVRLRGNGLNGSIPRGLFNLGLEVLDLSGNGLVGQLPPETGRLAGNLQWLDLSDNGLTGEIPMEMAFFFNLRHLNLSSNGLRSRLLPEFGSLQNLTVLDLRSNSLFGAIPGELCESGSLMIVQLDGNSLGESIPDEIGKCSSLNLLSLSHNQLTGQIPPTLASLKDLKILNLEFNNLTGEIPEQLASLSNLVAVNISHNRLTGRLPLSSIFQSLDRSSLDGNLGLCSPLVSEPCIMNAAKPLVLDPHAYNNNNNDDDNVSDVSIARTSYKRRCFFSASTIIAISAALLIILGVLVVSLLNVSARRQLRSSADSVRSSSTMSSGPAVGKTVLFSPESREELVSAESLMSKAVEIGSGGIGTVYRSTVRDGRAVAVKKLHTGKIVQYHEDFDREVRLLASVRHVNIASIKGYYWTPQLQLLIADYSPAGSLHTRLQESRDPLPWSSRFKILLGLAKGLAHLHHASRPPIVHFNVKPSNVLLDEDYNARVSDYGLTRLLEKGFGGVEGASMGYVAPELANGSMRVNEKCDVYAYGVVVLEVVTGRRPLEYGEDDVVVMVDMVRGLVEEGRGMDCVDGRMVGGEMMEEEVMPVMKLGLVCASQVPSSRPTMGEVVQILNVIRSPVSLEGRYGV